MKTERIPGSRKPPKLTMLDWAIGRISPKWGFNRIQNRLAIEAAMYRSADLTRIRADWIIAQDETTPSTWELDKLRERSRDLNRNDAIASGATETMAINIVGKGLRPLSRVRPDYLGITEERAQEIQRQAELIWQAWIPMADSANRLDFDEIQFLALRKIVEDGETLAIPVMAKGEKWRKIKRAIELIESDRLDGSKSKSPLDKGSGIDVGSRGEPKVYHIRKANSLTDSVAIKARDRRGRPNILHVFQTKRPGQLRGIPYFAPVLTLFKDLADYMEAEVVAARVAACLAVFITSERPYDAQYGAATDTETSTSHKIQGIEPGMVGYLNTGEEIKVVDPKRPGDSFAPFVEGILRMIGVSLNMPYEVLVKDFSKTNYSSARAALLEGRRMFQTWRGWFARKFCQPIWDLVLEEAFLRGYFDVPDFYKYRTEYTRALWIGGGWGWVDPVKEVEASRKAIDYGLSTLAEEAAGQGRDWEEVLEQRKREDDKAAEIGVNIMTSGKETPEKAQSAEEENE